MESYFNECYFDSSFQKIALILLTPWALTGDGRLILKA